MKRIKLVLIISFICIVLNCNDVFASTKVNIRTEGNYYVPSDVVVTESNKNAILSTPSVNAEEKIYDFAEILTDVEEETLFKNIKHFTSSTNIDYVIVTAKKNNKASSKDYTKDFYNYNNFGNDGIILLIDRDKNGIYMSTFGKAVELFSDERMEPILKNVFELTKKKKFYDACKSFTTSISEIVKIGTVKDGEVVKVGEDGTVKVSKDLHVVSVLLFSLLGTGIIIGILVLRCKMVRKATSARDYLNKDTMKIVDISEMFLGTRTFKASLTSSTGSKKKTTPPQGGAGIKK